MCCLLLVKTSRWLAYPGDGKVDLAEFFTLAKHLKIGQAEKDDLRAAFKVFDKDKNGKICKVHDVTHAQRVKCSCFVRVFDCVCCMLGLQIHRTC